MSEAHAMVSLIDLGWADQNDVAEAFGCSARTLRRHQRRFEEGGLAALGRPNGYPPGLALHQARFFAAFEQKARNDRQCGLKCMCYQDRNNSQKAISSE
jgi:transposase